jgi:hypothetical protein
LIESSTNLSNTHNAVNFYKADNNNDDLEGVEDQEASEVADAGKKKKKRNKRKKKKNKDGESNASVVRNGDDLKTSKFFSEDSAPK